jgi:hypothetical protein
MRWQMAIHVLRELHSISQIICHTAARTPPRTVQLWILDKVADLGEHASQRIITMLLL